MKPIMRKQGGGSRLTNQTEGRRAIKRDGGRSADGAVFCFPDLLCKIIGEAGKHIPVPSYALATDSSGTYPAYTSRERRESPLIP